MTRRVFGSISVSFAVGMGLACGGGMPSGSGPSSTGPEEVVVTEEPLEESPETDLREEAASSPSPAPAEVAEPTGGKSTGTLVSARGEQLVVTLEGQTPAVGSAGTVFKRVTKQLGKMSFEAWLDVASVRVEAVAGKRVTLTVTQENSVVTVNGQSKSHFTPGSAIRLEW